MSRLYPGWGSGKQVFEETFQVYPLACLGRDDMEGGDKVIMSQSTFRKVSRLKLPFPLTFEVSNPRLAKGGPAGPKRPTRSSTAAGVNPKKKTPTVIPRDPVMGSEAEKEGKKRRPQEVVKQYCGVLEFSAPEEKVFMPYWMMKNLRVKEGQKVNMKTVSSSSIPKGTLCRLQPHTSDFLDLAASMDLRELLEHSFRNYSVLSKGETIVVAFAGSNYKINVVETQPADAISLYGNLDLEVDFAPPLDSPDVGRMRPGSREKKPSSSNVDDDEDSRASNPNNEKPHLVGNNVMSFQQAVSTQQQNQNPSPKAIKEQQGHVWGRGQSLSGTVVDYSDVASSSSAAVSTSTTSNPSTQVSRRARRRPSKFASRTSGSSFIGDGTCLDPASSTSQDSGVESTAVVEALSVFSGTGRCLQGGAQGSSGESSTSTTPKANAKTLRERRLKFLENLEKSKNADKVETPRQDAVGSGLNAIRKAKN